jgi:methylated-DNA-[protein]-cysteine S-methyltransferase
MVVLKSPIGNIEITGSETGLRSVSFSDTITMNGDLIYPVEKDCLQQLDEYFQGKRKIFSLPLDLTGSDFQKKIWNELVKIPFGKTISYLELAMIHGDVKAIRAVGTANAKNPIAIIIPCHRVIGASGELTGYAGGLHRKKWLLEMEGSLHPDLFSNTKAL